MLKNKPRNHGFFILSNLLLFSSMVFAQLQNNAVLNEPPDISKDFEDYRNTYYLADELTTFNPETQAQGKLFLPSDSELHEIILEKKGSEFELKDSQINQKTTFKVEMIKVKDFVY